MHCLEQIQINLTDFDKVLIKKQEILRDAGLKLFLLLCQIYNKFFLTFL